MAAQIEPTLYPRAGTQPRLTKQSKRIKTIVADDSETFLEVLCEVLELEDDVEVVAAASDGVEAIQAAVRLKPALVLMDIHMPGLDGLSAASLLAELTPAPIVVLMSSEDSPELRKACQRADAFAFVHKTFLQQQFPQIIDRLLQMRDEQWTRETE